MKSTLAYFALALTTFAVTAYCLLGVGAGIAAVLAEVGRALAGAK